MIMTPHARPSSCLHPPPPPPPPTLPPPPPRAPPPPPPHTHTSTSTHATTHLLHFYSTICTTYFPVFPIFTPPYVRPIFQSSPVLLRLTYDPFPRLPQCYSALLTTYFPVFKIYSALRTTYFPVFPSFTPPYLRPAPRFVVRVTGRHWIGRNVQK